MGNIKKVDNNTFREMFNKSSSVTELAIALGYPCYYNGTRLSGTAYREIRHRCSELSIDYSSISRRIEIDDNRLISAVKSSTSVRDVLKKLDLPVDSGSKHAHIKKIIENLDISTEHFIGQGWSKGKNRFNDKRLDKQARSMEATWDESFCKGSKTSNGNLIKRLILSKKRKYECSICGLNSWNKKPLRLRLDHIDGDSVNNKEDNLRLLCPNCDSQTDTFCRGKTKKKSKKKQWWEQLI